MDITKKKADKLLMPFKNSLLRISKIILQEHTVFIFSYFHDISLFTINISDTFDVILSYPDKPYILDFGPLNGKTNLYAFSWKEINPLLNKVRYMIY